MQSRYLVCGAGFALVLSMSLNGCSALGANEPAVPESAPSGSSAAPEFSGPYAAEFADAYKTTKSDLARSILAKGTITESDYAETQNAYKLCMEDFGFTEVATFPEGGSTSTRPSNMSDNQADEYHQQCMDESGLGDTEPLYGSMQTNPNNEDWDQLCVQCLIDEGVVDSSFTVEDLNRWYREGDPKLRVGGPAYHCTSDPLGLLTNGK